MVKAIRVHELGEPEMIEIATDDFFKDETNVFFFSAIFAMLSEPQESEIRVRNKAVGLNFIDVYFRKGMEAIGPGLTGRKVGDLIAYVGNPMGSYAEEQILPAIKVDPVPPSIDPVVAVSVMLKGMTVQFLVRRCFRLIREDMERLVSLLGEPKRADLEALSGITEERRGSGGGLEKKKKPASANAAADDDDDNKRNVSVSVSLAKTTAAAVGGGEEDKAARIERLKSGFRICMPQGTFLWPSSRSTKTTSQLPCLSPRAGGVELELLDVPTPPSVTSSSSSTSQSQSHHHQPRLPELVMTKPPTSTPVKPLADKRPVQLSRPPPLAADVAEEKECCG